MYTIRAFALSLREEFMYKLSLNKYIKTIQNEIKSYKYHYQYINAIYLNIKHQ